VTCRRGARLQDQRAGPATEGGSVGLDAVAAAVDEAVAAERLRIVATRVRVTASGSRPR
jgi:hypothetical protein